MDVLLVSAGGVERRSPEELAGMLLYLVSDAGASVTGAALAIDGGWTAA